MTTAVIPPSYWECIDDEFERLVLDDGEKLVSTEQRQCEFVNTIGLRCPTKYWGIYPCCKDHQCTYMITSNYQCTSTVNCKTKWYCDKHSKRCQCQHIVDGKQCQQMVYFYSYKSGCYFCASHKCKQCECANPAGENALHLCQMHIDAQITCDYVTKDGNKCSRIIDRIECNNLLFDKTIGLQQEMSVTNYCHEHLCRNTGCRRRIRNDRTPYCIIHSIRCEHNIDNEDKSTHCHNYIKMPDDTIMKLEPEYAILCDEHKCHWTETPTDWKDFCVKACVKHDDCGLYCEEHYNIYRFHKFEFAQQS